MLKFEQLAAEYKGDKAQNRAIAYLEGWLTKWRAKQWEQFAFDFRGGASSELKFQLQNGIKYFSNKPHQLAAFAELSKCLNDDASKHFLELWPSQKELGIFAPVPTWQTQRNNPTFGGMSWSNTCNCSATAMQINSLLLSDNQTPQGAGFIKDDQLIKSLYYAGYNSSVDHNVVDRHLKEKYNWSFTFDYNLTFEELDNELSQGRAVTIGVLHKGYEHAPFGGHMIMVYGLQNDNYYVCDPWGDMLTRYSDYNGYKITYPKRLLQARWLVSDDPNDSTGWARLMA